MTRTAARWGRGLILACVLAIVVGVAGALTQPRLCAYVHREVGYQFVLDRLIEQGAETESVVRRVVQYVHEQVYPAGGPVIDTDSWTHLVRGIGWCDQKSWTVGTFLALAGVHSRLVMLRNEAGVSTHTVLEVLLEGEWRVVDPLFGLVFAHPDGSLATLQDLSDDLTILRVHPVMARLSLSEQEAVVDAYEALFPLREPPTIWSSIQEKRQASRAKTAAASAIHRLTSWLGVIWAYPVQDLYLALLPTVQAGWESVVSANAEAGLSDAQAREALRLYRRAREYHLYGRLKKAADTYHELVASFPQSTHGSKSQLWLGVAELQRGDDQAAIEAFSMFLETWPASPWRGRAYDGLAQAYQRVGDHAQAADCVERALLDRYAAMASRMAASSETTPERRPTGG